jgi:hypothetical protein
VQSNKPVRIKPNTQYDVLVAVNGVNVTLIIDGVNWFSYNFAPRLDVDGLPIPLNKGFVGVGMDGGAGTVDNFTVQVLPPEITLEVVDDFTGPYAAQTMAPATGNWSVSGGLYTGTAAAAEAAVSLFDVGQNLAFSAILELEAKVAPGGQGGLVFDYYGPSDFKFVRVDALRDVVEVGHVQPKGGLSIDQTYARMLSDTSAHTLKLSFIGAAVTVSVDNALLGTHGFNAALVDGGFGLVSFEGATAFDRAVFRTNDPAFAEPSAQTLMASTAAVAGGGDLATISEADLRPLIDEALHRWSLSQDGALVEALRHVEVRIDDLDGLELGRLQDGVITIDVDAAGHGWFVDTTPDDDSEFRLIGDGVRSEVGGAALGRMDLLSALSHELGHAAGYGHEFGGVMAESLSAGTRVMPDLKQWHYATAAEVEDAPPFDLHLIDWTPVAQWPEQRKRPAAIAAAPASEGRSPTAAWRTDDRGWKERFVNELAAPESSVSPNSRIQIQLSNLERSLKS